MIALVDEDGSGYHDNSSIPYAHSVFRYSRGLVKHAGVMVTMVGMMVVTMATVALFAIPYPDFSNPTKV